VTSYASICKGHTRDRAGKGGSFGQLPKVLGWGLLKSCELLPIALRNFPH
jgi:hypothetical protein